ncbi:hypothetical protein BLNAU_2740 [Blattamonas nauphoetae]|uniref:Uncharacterized protein n=1 Tax=Blattamonas nauphoetae TaxID=2049346 RepID=A0ABQ9YE76_9EUKA|nr:hypothetical protein BLNAU_2740 [Blattamonas nauphoetae]
MTERSVRKNSSRVPLFLPPAYIDYQSQDFNPQTIPQLSTRPPINTNDIPTHPSHPSHTIPDKLPSLVSDAINIQLTSSSPSQQPPNLVLYLRDLLFHLSNVSTGAFGMSVSKLDHLISLKTYSSQQNENKNKLLHSLLLSTFNYFSIDGFLPTHVEDTLENAFDARHGSPSFDSPTSPSFDSPSPVGSPAGITRPVVYIPSHLTPLTNAPTNVTTFIPRTQSRQSTVLSSAQSRSPPPFDSAQEAFVANMNSSLTPHYANVPEPAVKTRPFDQQATKIIQQLFDEVDSEESEEDSDTSSSRSQMWEGGQSHLDVSNQQQPQPTTSLDFLFRESPYEMSLLPYTHSPLFSICGLSLPSKPIANFYTGTFDSWIGRLSSDEKLRLTSFFGFEQNVRRRPIDVLNTIRVRTQQSPLSSPQSFYHPRFATPTSSPSPHRPPQPTLMFQSVSVPVAVTNSSDRILLLPPHSTDTAERVAAALGVVSQLFTLLAVYLRTPLPHPLVLRGSHSYIISLQNKLSLLNPTNSSFSSSLLPILRLVPSLPTNLCRSFYFGSSPTSITQIQNLYSPTLNIKQSPTITALFNDKTHESTPSRGLFRSRRKEKSTPSQSQVLPRGPNDRPAHPTNHTLPRRTYIRTSLLTFCSLSFLPPLSALPGPYTLDSFSSLIPLFVPRNHPKKDKQTLTHNLTAANQRGHGIRVGVELLHNNALRLMYVLTGQDWSVIWKGRQLLEVLCEISAWVDTTMNNSIP